MNLFSDLRFALRLLVKNPTSSAMAILVMAVGTGVAMILALNKPQPPLRSQ